MVNIHVDVLVVGRLKIEIQCKYIRLMIVHCSRSNHLCIEMRSINTLFGMFHPAPLYNNKCTNIVIHIEMITDGIAILCEAKTLLENENLHFLCVRIYR